MPAAPVASRATSPIRLWVYGLALALLAFVQRPGLMVADTKFDLVVDPGRFLARALQMWDSTASFGQIQNQAYGYFFPMGPFFWLGEQAHLDMWVVQRLWWTLLLCLAFFGVLKVAEALDLGAPWARVVAAFAYALGCHVTTVVGATSIEVWPGALAPWLLWCVVRGTTGGSERRWAAGAGLVMFACGGVNAAAVVAVLPLGVCWLLTRRGRRAWVFAGWWVLFTGLATLWWVVPLLLMGAYSFPFLDYIESASVTTLPTDLPNVLAGTSHWVYFYSSSLFPAGYDLATNPYLLLDALVLAALGIAGIARTDNPHRGFLFLGLVTGLLAVSFGYTGGGHGWFAEARQASLDGVLAPLRNLHKFDNVLRLPLVLGAAHLLGRLRLAGPSAETLHRVVAGVACLALVAIASPWWLAPRVAPSGPIESVPQYWREAADYLDAHDDGSTSLVVPAAGTALYEWGYPRDDVMQPLAGAPWATRNVIPFAQPGSVTFLNQLTDVLESGRPDPHLAPVLAANGVRYVVVRNDLDLGATGAPDPVLLHAVLDGSPHLERVAGFGPELGFPSASLDDDSVKVAVAGGLSGRYRAVEVYEVRLPVDTASVVDTAGVQVAPGGAPGDGLWTGDTAPTVLGDPGEAAEDAGVVLSDGLQRREEDFAVVRAVVSATMQALQPWRIDRPVHQRLMFPDQERWESVTDWHGVEGVSASSSAAWPDARPPMVRGDAPDAALDGSPTTAWRSGPGSRATGQWWQLDLVPGTEVDRVDLLLAPDTRVTRLALDNGEDRVEVAAADPGQLQTVRTGFGPSDRLRITAVASRGVSADDPSPPPFALAEVDVDGVHADRSVALPAPPEGRDVDAVTMVRDQGTPPCVATNDTTVCRDDRSTLGDDGADLDRSFTLPQAGDFDWTVDATWADGPLPAQVLAGQLPFRVEASASGSTHVRTSTLAMLDDRPDTAWIGPAGDPPVLQVTLPQPERLGTIVWRTAESTPAVAATRLLLTAGEETRAVRLDEDGVGHFRPLTANALTIEVIASEPGFASSPLAPDVGQAPLPVGAGTLELRGVDSRRNLLDASTQEFAGPCGTGPVVTVDGAARSTRWATSTAEALRGEVRVTPCGGPLGLRAGGTRVVARATDLFVVDAVSLARPDLPTGTSTPVTWTDGSGDTRTLDVPDAPGERLLVVSQNLNDGWVATLGGDTLEPQLVDGWRQGWWLPAGSGGTVTLTFEPQPWFEAGLVVGLLGVVVTVVGLLLRPRGRPRPRSRPRRIPPVARVLLTVAACGLLAGTVGALIAAGVGLALLLVRPLPRYAWLGAGGVALVAAALAAQLRADQPLLREPSLQWLLVGAVALALPVFSRGPKRRRRMAGTSIR